MAAERILPDNATLQRWIQDEGLTHQQIADRVYLTTGERVTRSSISAALSRAGLSKNTLRYNEEIPWRVSVGHIVEYPARMLRLLGRQRNGLTISDNEAGRLESWLEKLEADNAVVGYDPDSQYGFYYVEKEPGEGANGVPIRVQRIHIQE